MEREFIATRQPPQLGHDHAEIRLQTHPGAAICFIETLAARFGRRSLRKHCRNFIGYIQQIFRACHRFDHVGGGVFQLFLERRFQKTLHEKPAILALRKIIIEVGERRVRRLETASPRLVTNATAFFFEPGDQRLERGGFPAFLGLPGNAQVPRRNGDRPPVPIS